MPEHGDVHGGLEQAGAGCACAGNTMRGQVALRRVLLYTDMVGSTLDSDGCFLGLAPSLTRLAGPMDRVEPNFLDRWELCWKLERRERAFG
jgi:hypothetical protein